MKFKYICSAQTNPYYNMALEEYLFQFAEQGVAILYLWQNAHTIVIGKNQNPKFEVKMKEFMASGGCVARRKSGGGAVYHDIGNLNYSIISKEADKIDCSYQDIVIKVLQEFDFMAHYNGRNDIMIGDKKVSGNAIYTNTDVVCQHGTLLISEDLDVLKKYLTPDKSKLVRNHIKSVEARVMNLSNLSKSVTTDTMKETFIKVTDAEALKIVPDEEVLEELRAFYSKEKWIMGGYK